MPSRLPRLHGQRRGSPWGSDLAIRPGTGITDIIPTATAMRTIRTTITDIVARSSTSDLAITGTGIIEAAAIAGTFGTIAPTTGIIVTGAKSESI